jgi:hypothetical protein
MDTIIHWLETHQMPCYYKKFMGVECLGCGMQTALIQLLKGNLMESLKTYPALIPVLILLLFTVLHVVFRFEKGAAFLKYWFILTLVVMITSYLIKLFT